MLGHSVAADGSGRQPHQLLAALRRLGDPALRPLFEQAIRSGDAVLLIHGVLGLAECSPSRQLDLVRVAAIPDPALQAQVISAALDDDLLSIEQCQQLIQWPGMDPAIKIIVAARLIMANQFDDAQLLVEASHSDNLARRGLGALLRLQLGHAQSLNDLLALDRSDDPRRDAVRRMLLETAVRYELHRAAPWAAQVCVQPGVSRDLGVLALRVALRFESPHAITVWRQQFAAATDLADRTRLALIALGLAQRLDPQLFEVLTGDRDPLIQRIGQAGRAIASKNQIDVTVVGLIETGHPFVGHWALDYAKRHASDDNARVILLGLILVDQGQQLDRSHRLMGVVVMATEALYNRDPEAAVSLLGPILADPQTEPVLAQGILQGLLRCKGPGPDRVVVGLEFTSPRVDSLAVLLRAKHGHALTAQQDQQLKLLVRGGGTIQEGLRLQAGWIYLRRTQQSQLALATVVDQ